MLMTSFKPENQIVTIPIRWLPNNLTDLTFMNYYNVLAIPRGVDLIRSFLNSLTVATIGTLGVVVFDSLAAYALSRLRFPGRDVLFYAIVLSLIVPPEILLIPNYISVWRLDWLNTLVPLIVPPIG